MASTFVSPAKPRFRGSNEPVMEEFVSEDARIDKGARNVIAGDLVFAHGDFFENADEYRAKDPVSLEEGENGSVVDCSPRLFVDVWSAAFRAGGP